jgi:hypothetical protein
MIEITNTNASRFPTFIPAETGFGRSICEKRCAATGNLNTGFFVFFLFARKTTMPPIPAVD